MVDKYHILTPRDQETLSTARMGTRMGFGKRIAVIVIDAQVYMIGDRCEPMSESNKRYPSSCGDIGWKACENIKRILDAARKKDIPIFYSQMTMAADGWDAGVYTLKRNLLQSTNWMLEGTPGWEIAPMLAPCSGDHVFMKKKPSAFFGTHLISYLNDRGIDTLIITGGSTSNCVRATVFDSSSYNYHTIVAEDGVFDRIEISHKVSLFDMDRQWADVMPTEDILAELARR